MTTQVEGSDLGCHQTFSSMVPNTVPGCHQSIRRRQQGVQYTEGPDMPCPCPLLPLSGRQVPVINVVCLASKASGFWLV